jgi:hypothetical protein
MLRSALVEGRLRDLDGTPPELWRHRFETGNVVIDWDAGTMFIPWFDASRKEWGMRSARPQFRREDWLALFSVATPKVSLSLLEPWYGERVKKLATWAKSTLSRR